MDQDRLPDNLALWAPVLAIKGSKMPTRVAIYAVVSVATTALDA
jgi:hypothetical protein